jgi:hypothetical protein
MLQINLGTRPFYNVRAVHVALGLAAALVIALTLVNVVRTARLSVSQYTLGASASDAEAESERLQAEAVRIRSQINAEELAVVADAAREANAIIDQRAFSWTELFVHFEETLPPDVRVTAVQPRLERNGDFVIAIGVEARRPEDLDAFIESLEDRGGFRNVLSIQERTGDTGLIAAVIQGAYLPPPRNAPPPQQGGGQ